jgi:hypothetical protein
MDLVRHVQAKFSLRTQVAGVFHNALQFAVAGHKTRMSKSVLNVPRTLFLARTGGDAVEPGTSGPTEVMDVNSVRFRT